jgi:hypothetical protein
MTRHRLKKLGLLVGIAATAMLTACADTTAPAPLRPGYNVPSAAQQPASQNTPQKGPKSVPVDTARVGINVWARTAAP